MTAGGDKARRALPRGFVLAAVLLAMLLIAALVAGVLFAVTEETRSGAAIVRADASLIAAESAVETTLAGLSASVTRGMPIGGTTASRLDVEGLGVDVYVTRLDSTLYAVVGDCHGPAPSRSASRRVGIQVRAVIDSTGSITVHRLSERGWSELF